MLREVIGPRIVFLNEINSEGDLSDPDIETLRQKLNDLNLNGRR